MRIYIIRSHVKLKKIKKCKRTDLETKIKMKAIKRYILGKDSKSLVLILISVHAENESRNMKLEVFDYA